MAEISLQLFVGGAVEAPGNGFLQRSVHPLDVAIGPRVWMLGQSVLDMLLGGGKFAGAVDSDEEAELALFDANLGDVDVAEADGIGLEALAGGLVIHGLRQAADAMALQAPVQGKAERLGVGLSPGRQSGSRPAATKQAGEGPRAALLGVGAVSQTWPPLGGEIWRPTRSLDRNGATPRRSGTVCRIVGARMPLLWRVPAFDQTVWLVRRAAARFRAA